MLYKTTKDILTEFDNIIYQLINDEKFYDCQSELIDNIHHFNLLREELESDKQNIYVVGKTSTGKSAFHNFILDFGDSDASYEVFKTSTKSETGLIQTLQHCEGKENAYADILIKNHLEFKKVYFPPHINFTLEGNILHISLNNSDQVAFLSNNLMAKSDLQDSFNPAIAIERINIYHPLRFFKRFVILDTPGLWANDSKTTDSIVKKHIVGKSRIFWLLNGSEFTLFNSIDIADENEENKNLLLNNLDKIVFIANKFDSFSKDEDEYRGIKGDEIQQVIKERFVSDLSKVVGKRDLEIKLIFTSCNRKKLNKPIGIQTVENLRFLEDYFLYSRKDVNYNNISEFCKSLLYFITYFKDNHIGKEINLIKNKTQLLSGEVTRLDKSEENLDSSKNEVRKMSKILSDELRKLSECKIRNREAYNKHVNDIKKILLKSQSYYSGFIKAKLSGEKHGILDNLIVTLITMPSFEFHTENSVFHVFGDKELNKLKNSLINFCSIKLNQLNFVTSEVIDVVNQSIASKRNSKSRFKAEIKELESKYISYEDLIFKLEELQNYAHDVFKILLKEIELNISSWSPSENYKDENNLLENFLELNSLLDEHELIQNRI